MRRQVKFLPDMARELPRYGLVRAYSGGRRERSVPAARVCKGGGRNRRIFLMCIVVLNITVAVLSVRRGDTAIAIIFAAAAVLIVYQLIRTSIGGEGGDRDDRTPPSS